MTRTILLLTGLVVAALIADTHYHDGRYSQAAARIASDIAQHFW